MVAGAKRHRDAEGWQPHWLQTGDAEGEVTIVTSVIVGSILLLVAPVPGQCPCNYSFIGNDCCSYTFACQEVDLGPAITTSDDTQYITICAQTIQNCSPCTSSSGGCSGTITYTDTGSTSAVGTLQAQGGLNNALRRLEQRPKECGRPVIQCVCAVLRRLNHFDLGFGLHDLHLPGDSRPMSGRHYHPETHAKDSRHKRPNQQSDVLPDARD